MGDGEFKNLWTQISDLTSGYPVPRIQKTSIVYSQLLVYLNNEMGSIGGQSSGEVCNMLKLFFGSRLRQSIV